MINLGSSIFECETLFLQPSWHCAKSCSACYVKEKEHQFGSEEMSLDLWRQLLIDIMICKNPQVSQVTMALDTLPAIMPRLIKMRSIAWTYLDLMRSATADPTVEYHMTVNCINDLRTYEISRGHERLNLLSISNINKIEDIAEARAIFPKARINWNILSGSFVKKSPEQIKEILVHVDQAYLLLHKAPLGMQGHDYLSWQNAFFLLAQLRSKEEELIPQIDNACPIPNIFNKVIYDGCMQDSWNYIKDKKMGRPATGCSSNVNRFQIWPDGRVTGCAYNSHEQYGIKAITREDITSNLRDARTRYEFDRCTIYRKEKLVSIHTL